MIKVLHILSTSVFSGAENVVCQIINMFEDNSQISMSYCSPSGKIENVLSQKGITYIPIKKVSISEISRVVQENKPDIIHAHDIRASVVASICHKKIKLVSTIHVNDIKMRKFSIKSLSSILILKEATHIFWVSYSCMNEYFFKKFAIEKSSVLQNVINRYELLEKIKEDHDEYKYDVIYLGRMVEQKNPYRLLKVLELACKENKTLSIAIIGDGPLLLEIKESIAAKKLDKNIKCLGFVENPLKILAQAKLLILTSNWEGTPICVLEAMALGVPVVSTPTDGIVELIQNDISGFTSWDNVLLAKKINEYVLDENKREKLSQNIINKFNEINNIQEYKHQLLHYYLN